MRKSQFSKSHTCKTVVGICHLKDSSGEHSPAKQINIPRFTSSANPDFHKSGLMKAHYPFLNAVYFYPLGFVNFRSIVLEIMEQPDLARSHCRLCPLPPFYYNKPLASFQFLLIHAKLLIDKSYPGVQHVLLHAWPESLLLG